MIWRRVLTPLGIGVLLVVVLVVIAVVVVTLRHTQRCPGGDLARCVREGTIR
jgi:cell division protein FtsL